MPSDKGSITDTMMLSVVLNIIKPGGGFLVPRAGRLAGGVGSEWPAEEMGGLSRRLGPGTRARAGTMGVII